MARMTLSLVARPLAGVELYLDRKLTDLNARVAQWQSEVARDPFNTFDQAGNFTAFVDVLAERHILISVRHARPESWRAALDEMDAIKVSMSISNGPGGLRDGTMKAALGRWVRTWESRLEAERKRTGEA
jgi:hypothetical protein